MGIFVVGMHRSGTSALAGLLSALCQLPAGRLAVDSNPTGQWERPELRPAIDLMLAWNRATWAQPRPESTTMTMPWPLRAYAARVFARHCRGPFLWKDPRLCLTIDHWASLPQAEPRIVFIHRRPEAVARSLQRRNGWTTERGLALWERTNRTAVTRLGGREVYAIDHGTLVGDPEAVVTGLGRWLPVGDGTVDRAVGLRAAATIQRLDPTVEGDGQLTTAQEALADRLHGRSGPTRLDLDGVGQESPSTGPILGAPGTGELVRRTIRALRAAPLRHPIETAGSDPPAG